MVVGVAGVDQFPVITSQRFKARVDSLDEDVRAVTGRAEHSLDAEHFVTDGIAIPQCRQYLVNRRT